MRLTVYHILAGFSLIAGASCADVQTWTSVDGRRTIEGQFVSLFGSSVTIKRADGKTVTCQLTSLNEDSRVQAKRLADEAKSAPKSVAASASPAEPKKGLSKLTASKASGIPTEEEIKGFLTEYKETPSSEEGMELQTSFVMPKLKPDQLKDYQRKKKIPFQVTVTLYKTKMEGGKKKFQRLDGQGCFAVFNEAGEVVDRQRESLGKLCPS